MSDEKDFGPVTEAELDAARVSLPPPGGAAPQDAAKLAHAFWFALHQRDAFSEAAWRDVAPLWIQAMADTLALRAPPDAGRDAGGAPIGSLCGECGERSGGRPAAEPPDECSHWWNNPPQFPACGLCARCVAARPAAEPPDVREAARQAAAGIEAWCAMIGVEEGDAAHTLFAIAKMLRASLGAAPPTQMDAYEQAAKWCDERADGIVAWARTPERESAAEWVRGCAETIRHKAEKLRGAPAEPGEREGGT